VGLDGKQKMSKSLGNYIGVIESAKEMFGKIMSLPDSAMPAYAELLTDLDEQEFIDPGKPKEMKVRLAKAIVSEFHSKAEAEKSAEEFDKVFSKKEMPGDIEVIQLKKFETKNNLEAVSKLFKVSKSEVRRLIQQGAISVDGRILDDPNEEAKQGIYKVGKRKFKKLHLK